MVLGPAAPPAAPRHTDLFADGGRRRHASADTLSNGRRRERDCIVKHRNATSTHLCMWAWLVPLLIAAAASGATAQQSGIFERGAQLVSGFAGSFSSGLEHESGDVEQELEDATTYGGSYRYVLTPRISIEASVEFGRAEGAEDGDGENNGDDGEDGEDDDDGENGDDAEDGAQVTIVNVSGSITVNLRRSGRWVPFVSAGAGLSSLDVSGTGTESTFNGVFGAGILFTLTDRLLVRADLRDYVYAGSSVSAATLGALMLPEELSGVVNDISATAGLAWRF